MGETFGCLLPMTDLLALTVAMVEGMMDLMAATVAVTEATTEEGMMVFKGILFYFSACFNQELKFPVCFKDGSLELLNSLLYWLLFINLAPLIAYYIATQAR